MFDLVKDRPRNANIELYRCLCILGIILLHAITWGPFNCRGLDNLGNTGVIGFVLISAWFGVKFRMSKVIKIVAIAYLSSLVSYIICTGCCHPKCLAVGAWHYACACWYVWAYLLLMLLSPWVDRSIEMIGANRQELIRVALGTSVLLFAWGSLTTVPSIRKYVPRTAGLEELSGVMLFAVYAIARVVFKTARPIGVRWVVCIVIVSGIFVYMGFRHVFSPIAFVFAYGLFELVRRIKLPQKIAWLVCLISPSVFSIYVIHAQFTVLFAEAEKTLQGGGPLMICFLVTVITFIGCFLLDIPRRFLGWILRSFLRSYMSKIDGAVDLICHKVSRIA